MSEKSFFFQIHQRRIAEGRAVAALLTAGHQKVEAEAVLRLVTAYSLLAELDLAVWADNAQLQAEVASLRATLAAQAPGAAP